MSRLVAALLAAGLLSAWAGAADDGVLEAGRDVPPPATRKVVEPSYPPAASAAGIGGIVIVEIIIDEEGNVASARTIRSVPGLDEAALAAVRQWKYEVTRVDGHPVRVRQVVPITFSHRLPPMLRQKGIPELRQGATPAMVQPEGAGGAEPIEATVEVTLAPDGSVDSVDRRGITNPWTDSLAAAAREWRFAPGNADERIAFRVVAKFVSRAGGGPRVDLELTGLHVTSLEPGSSEPAATAAPADSGPKPTAATTPDGQAPSEAAEPRSVPAIDVVSAPVTPPPPPREPAVAGSSAVARVSLGVGVPDLVSGRQPIVPPMARLNGVTGRVDVVFSLDAAGRATVESSDGPEALKPQAEGAVGSWAFRRTTAARLFLVAHFEYTDAGASASVAVRAPERPTEPASPDQTNRTAATAQAGQDEPPAQDEQPDEPEQPAQIEQP